MFWRVRRWLVFVLSTACSSPFIRNINVIVEKTRPLVEDVQDTEAISLNPSSSPPRQGTDARKVIETSRGALASFSAFIFSSTGTSQSHFYLWQSSRKNVQILSWWPRQFFLVFFSSVETLSSLQTSIYSRWLNPFSFFFFCCWVPLQTISHWGWTWANGLMDSKIGTSIVAVRAG